jgi:hypothetical protein
MRCRNLLPETFASRGPGAKLEQQYRIIEDVRPEQIGVVDSKAGGAILYRVAVLVKYKSDSGGQERWISVDQRPESLPAAKLQAFRWKGSQCIVRWKPSEPTKAIVEVS